jgi:REP element-mobilizing transposase RayT
MQPDRFYHYYNRANGNEKLFVEEKNYQYFLQLLRKYIPPVADIYSYCLLPNHFHLVLKTKDESELPEEIRTGKRLLRHHFSNLFNAYCKAFNKTYNRRGSLFQKHPKHLEIDNNRYLREVILYVNCNAPHHNICEAEYYAHSSYHSLLSDSKTALRRDKVIELFGSREELLGCLQDKERRIDLKQAMLLEGE